MPWRLRPLLRCGCSVWVGLDHRSVARTSQTRIGTMPPRLTRSTEEAIEGGEMILNRIAIHGLRSAPVVYTQLLVGWSLGRRRAVLAAVDCSA